MDCSFPGSSVHEISQARILEWVANPGIKLVSPALAGRLFILLSHKRSPLYKYTGQILLDSLIWASKIDPKKRTVEWW